MEQFKKIFISIGTAIASFFGALYLPVVVMVVCNTLDFITGIMSAKMKEENITSKLFYKGIVKKVCMWLLVIVGVLIDITLQYSLEQFGIALPFSFLVGCVVAVWIVCNELLSILENLAQIGVPMPVFLKKLVRYLQQQTESKIIVPEAEEGEKADDESENI